MELSVRFFKRMILAALCLMILVPIAVCVVLGGANSALEEENRAARDKLAETQEAVNALLAQVEALEQAPQPVIQPVQPTLGEAQPTSYQQLYPELCCEAPESRTRVPGTVYLTFDDGPSSNTSKILDILGNYEVKATFFVTAEIQGAESEAILRRIVEEGHTIGIHTYTHNYSEVYTSIANYLADFKQIYDYVYGITGVRAEVFRFPGGSINAYNAGFYQELIAEMLRRGFTYYDWNVSGEENGHSTPASIRQAVVTGVEAQSRSIVLMHDGVGASATVQALPGILETLTAEGYLFGSITPQVEPIWFSYNAVV